MKLGPFAKRHAALIKRKKAAKPKPSQAPPKPSQAHNAALGPPFVNRYTAMLPREAVTMNYVPEVGPEPMRKRPPATTKARLPKKPRIKKH